MPKDNQRGHAVALAAAQPAPKDGSVLTDLGGLTPMTHFTAGQISDRAEVVTAPSKSVNSLSNKPAIAAFTTGHETNGKILSVQAASELFNIALVSQQSQNFIGLDIEILLNQLQAEVGITTIATMLFERASPEERAELLTTLLQKHQSAVTNDTPSPTSESIATWTDASAQATQPPVRLSETDLAEFRACAAANPWHPDMLTAPSAHITNFFEPWFGRGLTVEIIASADADLIAAYKAEIIRNPRKRIRALTKPHKLPTGAKRAISSRLAVELTPEELEEKRRYHREYKQRKRQVPAPMRSF